MRSDPRSWSVFRMLSPFARRRGAVAPRGRRAATQRLGGEPLEGRAMLATVTWDGGVDGSGTNFLDPVNWVDDVLPQPGDAVIIGPSANTSPIAIGGTVNVASIDTARSLDLRAMGWIANARMTTSGSASISSTGWSDWETGTLHNVTLAGRIDLSQPGWTSLRVVGDLTLDGGTVLLGDRYGTSAGRLSFVTAGTSGITGDGEVILGAHDNNSLLASGSVWGPSGVPPVDTFRIGPGVTIRGNRGWIGETDSTLWPLAAIVNQGTIEADAAPRPGEDPYGDFSTAGNIATGDPSIPVDLSGITDPLPEGVYASLRWGDAAFTLPGLVPGRSYSLRLHFAELHGIDRRFNVFVNGDEVLHDFSPSEAAGGAYKAVVESCTATSRTDGTIAVALQSLVDNAIINAIEVWDGDTRVLLSDCGSGPGAIGLYAMRSLRNEGTIRASNGEWIDIPDHLDNQGTITIDAASTISLGGTWTHTGSINVAGALVVGGDLALSAGTVRLQGGVLDPGGALVLSGSGRLEGSGTVAADVVNAASIFPGVAGVAGTIAINGSLRQTSEGILNLDLFPGAGDRLVVAGEAMLAGALAAHVADAAIVAGDSWTVLTSTSRSGSFDALLDAAAGTTPILALESAEASLGLVATRSGPFLDAWSVGLDVAGGPATIVGARLGYGPWTGEVRVGGAVVQSFTTADDGAFRVPMPATGDRVSLRLSGPDGAAREVVIAGVVPLDPYLAPLPPLLIGATRGDASIALPAEGDVGFLPFTIGAERSAAVIVTPPAGVRVRVEVLAADGVTVVGTADAPSDGAAALVPTACTGAAGGHVVRVTSLQGSGSVAVRVILDAAMESPAAAIPFTGENLITNGSFESGAYGGGGYTRLVGGDATTITGWVAGGAGLDWHAITGDAAHFGRSPTSTGAYAVDLSLDGDGVFGSIAQTFATVPGTRYGVSFLLAAPWFNATVRVSAAETTHSFSHVAQPQYGFDWTPESFEFVATAPLSTLTFEGVDGWFWGPVIDEVAVVALGGQPLDGSSLALSGSADRLAVIGTGSPSQTDVYSFPVSAGSLVSLALASTTAGAALPGALLELLDGTGRRLSIGEMKGSIGGPAIVGFVPAADGVCYARVSGVDGEYALDVTRGAVLAVDDAATVATAIPIPRSGPAFADDFESGSLSPSRWSWSTSGLVSDDPLCPGNRVLDFSSRVVGGDTFSAAIPITPGASYTLSFDYLGTAADAGGYAGIQTSEWEWWIAGADGTLVNDGQWHTYAFSFSTASWGVPWLQLKFENWETAGTSLGTALFDDILLTRRGAVVDTVTGVLGTGTSAVHAAVRAEAGDLLSAALSVPGAGATPGFAPSVDLLDAAGVVLASGSAVAPLSFPVATAGTYSFRVHGDGTAGAWVLATSGATGAMTIPAPAVASTLPSANAFVKAAPSTYRVVFDRPVLLSSLDAGDLTIGGVAAKAVTVIDARTAAFTISGLLPGDGGYAVAMQAGAVRGLDGSRLEAWGTSLTLDTVAPIAPIVALTSDTGSSATDRITKIGTLALGAVESKAMVEYSTDGGTTWKASFTPAEGANTVRVRQTDRAGNVSPSGTLGFTLDTKAPAAPVVALAANTCIDPAAAIPSTTNGRLSVTGIESGTKVEYSLNGGTWTSSFTAVQGENAVRARQTDVAGNVSPLASLTFILDTAGPTIQSVALPAAGTYGVGATLTFSVTFSEKVFVGFQNVPPNLRSTVAPSIELTLGGGMKVRATYQSGSGTTTLTFAYVIKAGDNAAAGIAIASSIVLPAGSSIKDAAGNLANLSLSSKLPSPLPKIVVKTT